MNFEISGWSYNLLQNTLRLTKKFEKCILSFIESLIAYFIQNSSIIAELLFLQERLGIRLLYSFNFKILLKFHHFLSHLTTREVTRTFSLQ